MNETIAKHRRVLFSGGLLLMDAATVLGALFAADLLRFHALPSAGTLPHMSHGDLLRAGLLALVAFLPAVVGVNLLDMRRGWSPLALMFGAGVAVTIGGLGFLALSYLVKEFSYSRLMVWIFCVFAWLGLTATRLLLKPVLRWCLRRGLGVLRLVIVGDSPVGRSLAAKIGTNPHAGLRIVGHLIAAGEAGCGGKVGAGRLEEAFEALQRARPHICLFAEPIHGREEMTALLARCQEEGISVWLATDLHERHSPRMELKEIEAVPVIVLGSLRLATWERLLKRAADIGGAAVLLVLASPFLLYAALRIRRDLGAPLLFRQVRVGFQGRAFTILKLRAVTGSLQASGTAGDVRVVSPSRRFCDFLRAYSLDEIPQLWNVLRGDMSLVGPRPETPDRVRRYNPWNRRRLQVKPGITGLAQIAGVRGEQDFDTKSRFDVRYVERQSLLLDLQILLRTPLVVWKRRQVRRAVPSAEPRLGARVPPVSPPEGAAGREREIRC